jgi:hypothetical protein
VIALLKSVDAGSKIFTGDGLRHRRWRAFLTLDSEAGPVRVVHIQDGDLGRAVLQDLVSQDPALENIGRRGALQKPLSA